MSETPRLDDPGPGLGRTIDVVRRRAWLVVGAVVAAILAAGLLTALEKPTYRAETKIVAGQGNSLFPPQASGAFQPFSATLADLVRSDVVARRVIADLDLPESPEALLKEISVSINPQTAVLDVSVTGPSPQTAWLVAHQIGIIFPELVQERFGRATQGSSPAEPPPTATVWDPAHVSDQPVSPTPATNLAIAAALGLAIGLLAAFLRDRLDGTLRTREAVEHAFGQAVIGTIPIARESRGDAAGRPTRTADGLAVACLMPWASIRPVETRRRRLRVLLVAGPSPGQGATSVAAGLGVAIARSGASVALVDADLHEPQLHRAFGLELRDTGIAAVLDGSLAVEDALEIPEGCTAGRLALVAGSLAGERSVELLTRPEAGDLVRRLAAVYDYVVIDGHPLLAAPETLALAGRVDGVVVVARRDRTSRREAEELRTIAERLSLPLVGVILTETVSRRKAQRGRSEELAAEAEFGTTGPADAIPRAAGAIRGRCVGTRTTGERCGAPVVPGHDVCIGHLSPRSAFTVSAVRPPDAGRL